MLLPALSYALSCYRDYSIRAAGNRGDPTTRGSDRGTSTFPEAGLGQSCWLVPIELPGRLIRSILRRAFLAQLGELRGVVLEDRLAGGPHLVDTPHRRGGRRLVQDLDVLASLVGDLQHGVDKQVHVALGLGL